MKKTKKKIQLCRKVLFSISLLLSMAQNCDDVVRKSSDNLKVGATKLYKKTVTEVQNIREQLTPKEEEYIIVGEPEKIVEEAVTPPGHYESSEVICDHDHASVPETATTVKTVTPVPSIASNEELDEVAVSKIEPTVVIKPVKKEDLGPLALGARKTLATFFQSCEAISNPVTQSTRDLEGVEDGYTFDGEKGFNGNKLRKITDKKAYVDSHIILSKLKNDPNYPKAPLCKDMTKTPPVYGYASRPKYKNRELDIFQKGRGVATKSEDAVSIDCSGFVSTSLAAMGLKTLKTSGPYTSNSTSTLHSHLTNKNSCLERASMNPEKTISSGDILNVKGSHTVIIDSVGEDPLGIERFSKAGRCDDITSREFNFTYIHSGTTRNSYGPIRVNANIHWGGSIWNNLRMLAVEMCKRKLEGQNEMVESPSISAVSSRWNLIRHRSKDPKCVAKPKAKLKGEDCVKECLEAKQI